MRDSNNYNQDAGSYETREKDRKRIERYAYDYESRAKVEQLRVNRRRWIDKPQVYIPLAIAVSLLIAGVAIHDTNAARLAAQPAPTARLYAEPARDTYSVDYVRSTVKEVNRSYEELKKLMVANRASEKQLNDIDEKQKQFMADHFPENPYGEASREERMKDAVIADIELMNVYSDLVKGLEFSSKAFDFGSKEHTDIDKRIEALNNEIKRLDIESRILNYDIHNPVETKGTTK